MGRRKAPRELGNDEKFRHQRMSPQLPHGEAECVSRGIRKGAARKFHMNDISGTMTQMMWRPSLIRLTQIGIPFIADGETTICYVDPTAIQKISTERVALKDPNSGQEFVTMATFVNCCHFSCSVTESCEVVAMLRDRALGHESKPQPA